MMRRMLVASAAVFALALAAPLTVNAQNVFVLAGAAIPSGDYGDFADTGWMAAGGVTFPIGEAGLWAGAEGLYARNSASSDVVDASFKLFSAMGLLGYNIQTQSSVSPYVWAGAGLMSLSNGDSESGFGFQFGGGVAFEGESNITPFVEARFQSASLGEGEADATISIIGLAAGVSIGVGGDN